MTGGGELPPALTERVGFALYAAAARAQAMGEEALVPLGLTGRHYGVLALLADRAPRPQHELGRLLHVDRTTMVALLDDLEARELVTRRRNPDDRRANAVAPTSSGRALQQRAADALAACDEDLLRPLAPDDRERLRTLLLALVEGPEDG